MSGFRSAALGLALLGASAFSSVRAASDNVPRYKVDPYWPQELPNNWVMGQVAGISVDGQDHIWVLQRPRSSTKDELGASQTPPRNDCCVTTPAVLEFDTAGKLIRSWGGPGFVPDWPSGEHAIFVDKGGNVWISGSSVDDRQVLKFTPEGKQLLEIGRKSKERKNNQDTTMLGRVAGIDVDDAGHEVYLADGYLNNRIVVFDSNTGAFKRGWGAYGIALSEVTNTIEGVEGDVPAAGSIPPYAPGDPPDKQFRSPVHCVRLSADGLVYVCDRHNNRVQVFTKQGKYVSEFFLRTNTLGNGSTWTLTFSRDPQQKYLFVVDGENNRIAIVRRSDGVEVGSFGHSGRNAGQFHWVHQIGIDSKGNLYTGEVDTGKRVQKFILQH
jgi:DNA-binding beta-propeller fold protein YncE